MARTITVGYYQPPFTVRINYSGFLSISKNKKEVLFWLLTTIVHEWMHLFQFFIIAHANKKYHATKRCRKIFEHQAYYMNYIIAKIMKQNYDYHGSLKAAWEDIDKEE